MSVNMDKGTAGAVHIHVGHNTPGYLPESDIMCFDNVEDALDVLRHEVKDQQDYCRENCTAETPEQREKGSDCCEWCAAASDAEAALSALAHGGAAWRLIEERPRPFSILLSPPEGPDVAYWAEAVGFDREELHTPTTPTPRSGYTPCACRDCMDTTVSSDTAQPELCPACAEAGCEPCTWIVLHPGEECRVGRLHECQRDDAYGEC